MANSGLMAHQLLGLIIWMVDVSLVRGFNKMGNYEGWLRTSGKDRNLMSSIMC